MAVLEFDYVVVGAGSAGAALAARLSEREDRTVAVLEAGGYPTHPFIHVPAAVAAAIGTPALNWRFETVPQPGMAGRRIPVPRGKVLGGSGQINGMVYFRGHPTDFDSWAEMGAKGWSYREVLPYFTRTEHNEDFQSGPFHGRGGPVNVSHVRDPNPLNQVYMEALDALGFKACADFNGPDPEGYGLRQGLLRAGRRESTARAMLTPAAAKRRNLSIMTQAQVARLLFRERKACGVELTDGRRILARAEVVLCAGAIQSPQLLLASGIGPAEHLQALGIPVVHHLPGVGGNYHDHVASPVHMETEDSTSYGISWKALPRGASYVLRYLWNRSGPFGSNLFESVAFLRTDPALAKPDVQFVFQPAKRLTTRLPLPVGHGFGISPVALYPKSRGTLRLATPDVRDAPLIDPQLLAHEEDIQPLIRAVRIARRAFATPGFERYRAVEVVPGPSTRSDEEIAAFIRSTAYTVHHPCGTCRIGMEGEAVVDPDLRVRGLDGLRVADASVFPLLVGGNTNAAAVMVGERGADKLLGLPDLPPAELPAAGVGLPS